jgi:hypothetical protein
MKKNYQQPTLYVECVQQIQLLSGSLNKASGNAGLDYKGSDANYNGDARSRSFGWDDDE